jgi:hypothetical protein
MHGNVMRGYVLYLGPLVLVLFVLPMFMFALLVLHALGFEAEVAWVLVQMERLPELFASAYRALVDLVKTLLK